MTRPLGETFAPTASADDERPKANPARTAIQVLSMRLPRVRGARSISPLVGEPGSAARREVGGFSPDSAVLEALMRSQAPTGTSDAMSAPMGSLPGASSAGASNPMAAAMAGLGGGMMNAQPGGVPGDARPPIGSAPKPAPVIVPGVDQAPDAPPAPTPAPTPAPPPGGVAPQTPSPKPEMDPRLLRALMNMVGSKGMA